MATVYADFNAGTSDGRIRLTPLGSRESLAETGAKPGDWVWLSDGELRVGGEIQEGEAGLVALPIWETLEDIGPDPDNPTDPRETARRFKEFIDQPESRRDYPQILRLLARLTQIFEGWKRLVFKGFATTSGVFRPPRTRYEIGKASRDPGFLGKT